VPLGALEEAAEGVAAVTDPVRPPCAATLRPWPGAEASSDPDDPASPVWDDGPSADPGTLVWW
jgi:hypothetical protein